MAMTPVINAAVPQDSHQVIGDGAQKESATSAVQASHALCEQKRVLELRAMLDWDPSFDYKSERSRE